MRARETDESERRRADERERRFQALERMSRRRPRFPEAEVEADIAAAIAAVRAERSAERLSDG